MPSPQVSPENESGMVSDSGTLRTARTVRNALIIVAGALLGAIIAVVATTGAPTAAAEARVRLHDSVDWPEHDAVRLEILSWLDDETFNGADELVGGALRGLDADLPRNQSFLNVVATADDDDSAMAALDFAVAQLVERDDEFSVGPSREILADAEATLAAVSNELADITPAAEAGDLNAVNERGALTWRVEELETAVDEAQRTLTATNPRIYQIGETKLSDAQRFRRLRIIAASGLVTALGVAAALTLVGSGRSRTRPTPLSS